MSRCGKNAAALRGNRKRGRSEAMKKTPADRAGVKAMRTWMGVRPNHGFNDTPPHGLARNSNLDYPH